MQHITICVTGGTGFVGQEVVRQLLESGYAIHALVRSDHSAKKLWFLKEKYHSRLQFFTGNATEPNDIIKALEGCTAFVHLVGTKREEIKNTGLSYADVDLSSALASAIAMQRTGLKRILLLSAGAIGNSEYVLTKQKPNKPLSMQNWTGRYSAPPSL